jgi:hypothetical protein
MSLDGINLTGEDTGTYARSPRQILSVEDLGPRYSLSLSYRM